jgi:hypothetical protein
VHREYQHVRIETLFKKLPHSINVVVLYCIHKHLLLLWYCRRRCFIIRCMGSQNWREDRHEKQKLAPSCKPNEKMLLFPSYKRLARSKLSQSTNTWCTAKNKSRTICTGSNQGQNCRWLTWPHQIFRMSVCCVWKHWLPPCLTRVRVSSCLQGVAFKFVQIGP